MTWASNDDRELLALRELSAALGADPLRTQGAGGNISVKRDGILWIKASGTWLADALAHDIMIPVRLDPLREAIAQRDPRAAAAVDFVELGSERERPRPSIETSVHAVIPSPVVVHIHCVNTIALAVRRDGEALVRERLGAASRCRVRVRPVSQARLAARHRGLGTIGKGYERFRSRQSWPRRRGRDGCRSRRSHRARMRGVFRAGAAGA